MKFEIKSRFSGEVLFAVETDTLKACLVLAVKGGANLDGANLYGANLYGANLYGANLTRANLTRANLDGANLYGANLTRANLTRANLDGANLYGANLYGANLDGANLYGANLDGANLEKLDPVHLARLRITPSEGAFVGWKKLKAGVIAQLVILHDAQRLNAIGSRKCRASAVSVWTMWKDGVEAAADFVAFDKHSGRTAYQVGKVVTPDSFDPDVRVECSHGIHFFITREEAENY